MILRDTDYANDTELTAALDAYLSNAAADPNTSLVYLNRAKYDLDRKCEQDEFFLNVLHHQTTNGFQDTPKFAELPTYTISLDGDLSVGILETLNAVVAAAGDSITITVADDGSSGAFYAAGTLVTIEFYDNPDFTGSAVVNASLSISNNAGSVTFTVPATHEGPLFGRAQTNVVPSNQVTVELAFEAATVYNLTQGQVLGYYNHQILTTNFTFSAPLNSGITASDYFTTSNAIETGTLNFANIGTGVTPSPTTFSFQPGSIRADLDAPVTVNLTVDTV